MSDQQQLSYEDAVAAIVALPNCKLSADDIRDIAAIMKREDIPLEKRQADLQLLVQTYKDMNYTPDGPSTWETIMKIMSTCAQIAGLVIPMASAVSVVYGLTQLGK